MTTEELLEVDVDSDGRTSGYVVETYVADPASVTVSQRLGEQFVRIAADPGGPTHVEVRIPIEFFVKFAERLKG